MDKPCSHRGRDRSAVSRGVSAVRGDDVGRFDNFGEFIERLALKGIALPRLGRFRFGVEQRIRNSTLGALDVKDVVLPQFGIVDGGFDVGNQCLEVGLGFKVGGETKG